MQNVNLAEWVASVGVIPAPTKLAAVRVVADAVAAAAAGHNLPGAVAARNAALDLWGTGDAAIWFTAHKGAVSTAAFSNAMATCILDLDDGHRAAAGHPGAAVVPAVIAAVQSWGLSGEKALSAIAIGYEVGVRIAASRDLRRIDTLISGRWCGQAVAAALGWLRGDSAHQIAEAMAVAGAIAPHMVVAEYTEVGNHTKEAIPFSVANGIVASRLASQGFKGPLDILDADDYDAGILRNGQGAGWYVETTYFKPYSCCRWIHAPIDAILKVRENVNWADVDEIEVETFERTLSLNNQTQPKDVQAAQYSTPFCVAAAALHGQECLQPLSDGTLQDTRISKLAEKVRLTVAPDLDAMFPASVPSRVRIKFGSELLEREVLAPKGEPSNPMNWNDLIAKLQVAAMPRFGLSKCEGLIAALTALRDHADLQPLLSQLSDGK